MPLVEPGDGNRPSNPSNPGDTGAENPGGAATSTNSIANIKKQLLPSKYDGTRYYSSANMKPSWIVIHNVGPGSASACYNTFNDPNGRDVSTHFTCDDKEIIQMLEVSWKGIHTNGNAMSKGGCSEWANTKAPAVPCGANNSNSIGIEVGNNGGGVTSVNEAKGLEVAIELTRYLMKELNIDADHVVRHGDTQPKNCPSSIMSGDGSNWVYFKEQITKRNQENKPIELNTSNISVQPGNNMGQGGTSAPITQLGTGSYGGMTLLDTPLYAAPTDIEVQLPDVDHRENTTNMDEVKGLTLIFYPPYNSCEGSEMETHFKTYNWDRTYHYVISKQGIVTPAGAGGTEPSAGIDAPEEPEDGDVSEEGGDIPVEGVALFTMSRSKKTVFVGDSLFVDLKNNVSGLTVFAEDELTIYDAINKYEESICEANPDVIVWYIGSDSAGLGDADTFGKNLDTMFKSHKVLMPNAQIYICKLFSGDESKATDIRKDIVENIPSYNNAIINAAEANNIPIIDCTDIPGYKSYYDDSGILFEPEFYDTWYEKMTSKISSGSTGVVPDAGDEDPDSGDNNPGTNTPGTTPGTGGGGGEIDNGQAPPLELPEGDPVGGDKTLEDAEGFEIKGWIDEKTQSRGFTDNDTHTYIDRALFQNKREKHNLTVALICPKDVEDYPAYEKALIEGVALILHEHGLGIKDLWREFDLNRAPSPFLYLNTGDTNDFAPFAWQDLLSEIEKQLDWRIKTQGAYTKIYTPYSAGSSDLSGGSTGSIGTPSTGIGITPGVGTPGTGNPIQGPTEMKSENEVVNTAYATLTGLGCTPECACAIIGNMQQESSLRPSVVNSIGASGLCQWLDGRLTGLKNYAASKGTAWTDVATQCEWAIEEIKGKDPTTKSFLQSKEGLTPEGFMQLTDLSRAVDAWRKCFERCGEHEANDAKRLQYANNWYSKIVQKEGSGGSELPPGITDDDLETASLEPVLFTIQPRTPETPEEDEDNTGNDNTQNSAIFGWPLPGISKVSSKFGPRTPPCKGASSMHGGIDIGAASGTPIMAYASGTIVQNVAWNKSAGNYIKIDHGNGVASRYLHMVEPSPLAVGTVVQAGQQVGKVGNTGVGTGAHLHFEIHINGEKVDPLLYVNPGGGTKDNPNVGSTPVVGTPVVSPGTGGGGNVGTIGPSSDNLLYDDKKQPTTNAPISGNSAGGQNHDDWGGVMVYQKGEPTDPSAEKPEIQTIITQEMYNDIIQYSDFKLVDDYVMDFEPYSKGLASVEDNQITMNDRINAMTKQFTTSNENTFHYKVIESGPGSKDHCVTIAEELNYLAVPQDLMVEPIYPDLVIPPGYVSTDTDMASPNSIPIATVKEGGSTSSDSFTKQISFDYDQLQDKVKQSNKTHHPINYTDPYPYDEKITDLERHYPKVFIDEIEGQLYSCNHPGCPISQPMAKNFAMVSDAMMNQSKRIEKRLSRIENILSTIIRNQGRLGSRMNINCVYYGGHSTFNKYKCIRCLHDDRVHDGELVTIDQCLNCTRFEPILGQVYRILDDSGLNGSIILDDMQMSYTDLEGFRNLNDITHRSSRYHNSLALDENNCIRPSNSLIDLWKEADKERAIAEIREESTDESDAQSKIDALKEEDYIFKMDWAETFFNSQEPDTKLFPNEGIVARQKAESMGDGEDTLEDLLTDLDPTMDAAIIEEIKEKIKIRDNVWVDTREIADSVQVNKYSSENFFFEDFNKVRIGKYGIKFSALYNYNGEDYNNVYTGAGSSVFGGSSPIQQLGGSNPGSVFASNVRDKIVEMAKKILQDCNDGKAWYSQPYRTCEYDKPVTIKSGNGVGKTGYDCTSFVSCCYMYAGLKSMYAKSCSGGTLVREIQNGGKMIPCNSDNMQYILPGDILLTASGTVTQNDCNQLKFITTSHAAIYVGNNQIIHARGRNYGIQASSIDNYLTKGNYFFVRPADLLASDLAAAQNNAASGGSGGVDETSGTINGQSYVAKIPQAVVTAYTGSGAGASGMGCTYNATCASHNMPYGTKIYIPGLAGQAGNGIFTVTDTGGCFFDFDIFTNTWSGKTNMDAYVLSWGSGKTAASYTWAIDYYVGNGRWSGLIKPWNTYKNMGGKLINFTKYNSEDANITSHAHYND